MADRIPYDFVYKPPIHDFEVGDLSVGIPGRTPPNGAEGFVSLP